MSHAISDSAKDLVKKLLVKDPDARATAAQALCMFLAYFFLMKLKIDVRWWVLCLYGHYLQYMEVGFVSYTLLSPFGFPLLRQIFI